MGVVVQIIMGRYEVSKGEPRPTPQTSFNWGQPSRVMVSLIELLYHILYLLRTSRPQFHALQDRMRFWKLLFFGSGSRGMVNITVFISHLYLICTPINTLSCLIKAKSKQNHGQFTGAIYRTLYLMPAPTGSWRSDPSKAVAQILCMK